MPRIRIEAEAKGILLLDEAQLQKLLAGQEISVVEKPVHQGEEGGGALLRLEGLLGQPLTDEVWHQLCLELDRCSRQTQAVGADLVMERLQGNVVEWADHPADAKHTRCFQPTLRWIAELLKGEDHPKFRIVRALTLFNKKLTGRSAAPILGCRNLCNIEVLDLRRNNLSTGFWTDFAEGGQFRRVHQLACSTLAPKAALALGRPTAFPEVVYLELSQGNADREVMANLLGQGAFRAVETLALFGAKVGVGEIEALVAAGLPELKNLNLGSYNLDHEALVSTLVGATDLNLDVLEFHFGLDLAQRHFAVLKTAPQFANTTIRL